MAKEGKGLQQTGREDGTDAQFALQRHLETEDSVNRQGEDEDVVAQVERTRRNDVCVIVHACTGKEWVPDLLSRDTLCNFDDDGGAIVEHAEGHET